MAVATSGPYDDDDHDDTHTRSDFFDSNLLDTNEGQRRCVCGGGGCGGGGRRRENIHRKGDAY